MVPPRPPFHRAVGRRQRGYGTGGAELCEPASSLPVHTSRSEGETLETHDPEIESALTAARCPYGRFYGEPYLPLAVVSALEFVGALVTDASNLEQRLDAFVASIGGTRESIVDPWTAPRRAFRALLGKDNPTTDVWLVPVEWVKGRRETG